MDKPRLLVVEDEETIRKQMKWALNEEYDVILAEHRACADRRGDARGVRGVLSKPSNLTICKKGTSVDVFNGIIAASTVGVYLATPVEVGNRYRLEVRT